MSDPERPDFSLELASHIEEVQNRADSNLRQQFEHILHNTLFPEVRPAPKVPKRILLLLAQYARTLYIGEGHHYPGNLRLREQLEALSKRIVARAMGIVSEAEVRSRQMGMSVFGERHGLTSADMRNAMFDELATQIKSRLGASNSPRFSPEETPLADSPRDSLTSSLPPAPQFSEELRRLLTEARWRPEDVAEKIGIEPRNVYRHLAGKSIPSLVNIGRYEAALTKKLGRTVSLPTSVKRHNVSKTSSKRQ